MAHETFISHSSEDKIIADAVTASLEQAGIRCWIAPRDIRPGDSWGGAIVAAIEASRVMVVIFSAKSNDSKQVMREVERAVQHDVVVVPFRIEDVQPTRDMEYFLSSTHWLDAMSPAMDAHLQELTRTVSNILEKDQDEKAVAMASKKAAAALSKVARGKTATVKSGSRLSGILTGVGVAVVLGLAALLIFSGDDESSPQSRTTSEASTPKDVGDIKLQFTDTARAGSELEISWSGKSAAKDYIVIVAADAADSVRSGNKRIDDAESLRIELPDEPGDYEVRYFDAANNTVIARSSLTLQMPEITLTAPSTGLAGTEISVEWVGPNDRYDQLTIAEQGADGRTHLSNAAIAKGSPTSIRLPDLAGKYELRYVSGGDRVIWESQSLEVTLPEVSIDVLAPQIAGAEIDVKWQGPANRGDFIAVAEPSAPGNEYLFYVYVKPNQDAKLRLPAQEGDFEVRYISGQSREIWAVQPVSTTMPNVSVQAPSDVRVGEEVKIVWEGPANKGDFISIALPGTEGGQYEAYKYIKPDQVVELQMPQEAGEYEVRYISGVARAIWAEAAFTVLARSETLTAPEQVVAEDTFTVSWLESGHRGQIVGVYPANSPDDARYSSYAQTHRKTDTKVRAPKEPGDYELRYVSGNKNQVWGRRPLKVVAGE